MTVSSRSRAAPGGVIETDVSARLDRLPWGRFHTLVVLALGITWVLDGLEVTLAGALAGALKASPTLQFSNAEIGLATSSYLAGAVLGAVGFGWLTDRQLDAVARSRGLVGLNFATAFLREDGHMDADTPLDTMRRHLDAMLEHLGEGGVALGSDFDGATIPAAIGSSAGLPRLFEHLSQAGYGDALLERIAWRNWMDVLRRTFREEAAAGAQ